ncbi:uncharacterized protein B0J16DRAFT_47006 [Fusarium flagelliforme]|uniref:LysM domain-containing protein n=1 Tax=Fusarium flagelliforme TaxID=2675880 RepID=A0A395MSS1_9HYPO|nr:uncharacterized protein B0J16DRAFT_47006 [Fusarium flagelliforme]KAH7198843.1 hypothetical protein B0J16DRAFT_47006 [Fusarium flagelliforme]RFN50209.1 hypothetical protein FIE12Z_5523 [Fusarium flagelliforme]
MKFSTIASLFLANAGLSLAAPAEAPADEPSKVLLKATAIESTTGDNDITTPLPIQPGMVKDCDRFHLVQKNEVCLEVTDNYGISFEQFKKWNPTVGDQCEYMWADAYVCTHTVGYRPPKTVKCYGSSIVHPWGADKADALAAANEWCYRGGGGGTYEAYEKKETCINAPSGKGSFTFMTKTTSGSWAGLTGGKCRDLLSLGINGCTSGSRGNDGFWMYETAFMTYKCDE